MHKSISKNAFIDMRKVYENIICQYARQIKGEEVKRGVLVHEKEKGRSKVNDMLSGSDE